MVSDAAQTKYEVTDAFSASDADEQPVALTAGDIFEVAAERVTPTGDRVAVICKPGLNDYLEIGASELQQKCRAISAREFMQRDEKFGTGSWNWALYNRNDVEDDCGE